MTVFEVWMMTTNLLITIFSLTSLFGKIEYSEEKKFNVPDKDENTVKVNNRPDGNR